MTAELKILRLEEKPKKSLVVCRIEVLSESHCNVNQIVTVTIPEYLLDQNVVNRELSRTFVISLAEKEKFAAALCAILGRI